MAIILEGVDCSGKTTFAEKLAEKTGFEIVKGSSFGISKLGADGMYEYMKKQIARENVIIDRSFYSNLVYGTKYNYPMMKTHHYYNLLELANITSVVVYLYASVGEISYRMKKRGDDMIDIEDIDDILIRYDRELSLFKPATMVAINTENISTDRATNMVKELYEAF